MATERSLHELLRALSVVPQHAPQTDGDLAIGEAAGSRTPETRFTSMRKMVAELAALEERGRCGAEGSRDDAAPARVRGGALGGSAADSSAPLLKRRRPQLDWRDVELLKHEQFIARVQARAAVAAATREDLERKRLALNKALGCDAKIVKEAVQEAEDMAETVRTTKSRAMAASYLAAAAAVRSENERAAVGAEAKRHAMMLFRMLRARRAEARARQLANLTAKTLNEKVKRILERSAGSRVSRWWESR
jgi:hypothetical protein